MKLIPFNKNKYTKDTHFMVSDEIYDNIKEFKWNVTIDSRVNHSPHLFIYRCATSKEITEGWPRNIKLHRYIFGLNIGQEKVVVDHKNGWLDNTFDSLRKTDNKSNSRYRKGQPRTVIHNIGLPKGVTKHKDKKRYRSDIQVNGKKIYLGLYFTSEEAYKAYVEAAIKYFGEFAKI